MHENLTANWFELAANKKEEKARFIANKPIWFVHKLVLLSSDDAIMQLFNALRNNTIILQEKQSAMSQCEI
jgi:hypothetical protein